MNSTKVKPFVKWAGGKRQLLPEINSKLPKDIYEGNITRYIEPFLGGGAVFFDLISKYKFNDIVINDINKELILTYRVIKEDVEKLIIELKGLEESFLSKDHDNRQLFFYDVRDKFNKNKDILNLNSSINYGNIITHSAYFLFLNRTCFNGLFRVNKKGYFNVPFGKYKNPKICDTSNLREVNRVLQSVTIITTDFSEIIDYANNNTFVYFDPPYRPLNVTSSFDSYSKSGFNDDEQKRLGDFFKLLHKKGCYLMLSNSNPKNTNEDDNFFHDMYKDFTINEVMAGRMINSNASKRGKISELLITNY